MGITILTQETFQKEILDHKGIAFVDFYADWCGPCKMTEPIIEDLSKDADYDNIKFCKIDVDTSQEISLRYNIFSIPTFMIFKDGQPISHFVGAHDKAGFISEIKKVTS